MGGYLESFLIETRSHDAFGKFERGNRDKYADSNFSGFCGIEVFEEIVHGSSPCEIGLRLLSFTDAGKYTG